MNHTDKEILASLVEGRLNRVFKETVIVKLGGIDDSYFIASTRNARTALGVAPEELDKTTMSFLEKADDISIMLGYRLLKAIMGLKR